MGLLNMLGKMAGLPQVRVTSMMCAVTSKPFTAVYEKPQDAEKYWFVEATKATGSSRGTASPMGDYPVEEFDTTKWTCPHCERKGLWIKCGCGGVFCWGTHRVGQFGKEAFDCPTCRKTIPLERATRMPGSEGARVALYPVPGMRTDNMLKGPSAGRLPGPEPRRLK